MKIPQALAERVAEIAQGFYRPASGHDRVVPLRLNRAMDRDLHPRPQQMTLPFRLTERELAEDFAATFS